MMEQMEQHVGIVGVSTYVPDTYMSAKEIAEKTYGNWSEQAVKEKLGILQKPIPNKGDGTQEMGVKVAQNLLKSTGFDPKEIDVILCVGEEWKEYPLSTSAIYIQEKIGASRAWGIDVQNRCCTTITAMKMAKGMILGDPSIHTVLICGGYRNGDLVDYADPSSSMFYNLSAGSGAILLKRNHGANILLDTQIITDGSMAHDSAVEIGGINHPITHENLEKAYKSLKILNPEHMKNRLNEVSLKNWYYCIDKALENSGGLQRSDIDYLAILHFKRSMHLAFLNEMGLDESQSIYLENYGHMGQIDQILSLELALKEGKLKEGDIVAMVAAGIGYVWAANIIRWGKV